ncbi:hypothetical protein K8S19_04505 [bacterium]|nr:hypothetical protein [bacterium]
MKRLSCYVIFCLLLISGCATCPHVPDESPVAVSWPGSFQADYLWEGDVENVSLTVQPKLVRFYVRNQTAVRILAFNFLGATILDMTLQRSDAGKIKCIYHIGSGHSLAKWMAKMTGQLFFSCPKWRGWQWRRDDSVKQSGVLKTLVFTRRQQQRQLTVHQVHIGPVADTLFQKKPRAVQE